MPLLLSTKVIFAPKRGMEEEKDKKSIWGPMLLSEGTLGKKIKGQCSVSEESILEIA